MAMLDRIRNFFDSAFPLGKGREKTKQIGRRELFNPIAYVDPSLVISRRMFTAFNPDLLVTKKGMGIFDDMKRDEQVKAALKFKKDALLSPGWEIVSPEGQPNDWEVTRFVKAQLSSIEGGWHKATKKFLLSLDYGFSVTEKVYAPVVNGEWAGKIGLSSLTSIKPHHIDFLTDEFGKLLSVVQRGAPVSKTGKLTGDNNIWPEYPPAKFVIYTNSMEFENFYGTSDLAAAYRPWWIKDNAYKWLAIYLERYGMPPLVAIYNSGAYQGNQLEELKKFIKAVKNGTFGMIPRLNKEDLEMWSQQLGAQSKEIFLDSINKFDRDISRALLVPGLIGMTADESTGSLARAGTHFDAFILVLSEAQEDLASNAINDQIIPQLCDLNFPNLDAYPQFRFLAFKDERRLELLKTWNELVTAKVVNRIEDDEQHVRRMMGFPDNDEPVLEPLPSDIKAQQPAGGGFGKPKPKVVRKEVLSPEMELFAEDNGGVWIEVGGQVMCVDEQEWLASTEDYNG